MFFYDMDMALMVGYQNTGIPLPGSQKTFSEEDGTLPILPMLQ
jgi:hypothetical protein